MKKFKSIEEFSAESIENKEVIMGGIGAPVNDYMTDNFVDGQTGPYQGECDCITTRDGMPWNVQSTGTVTCE